MVIFIDDLDRCMPQVALRVLEALKLYLNIKQLIFVVGVDKNVIDPLVKKHYKDLGLEEYKSGNYLAKMFQTEVTVGPSEDQVVEYLDFHLDNVEYFNTPYIEKKEKKLFRDLINGLADRNPREVKRLINSAVMSGAGVEMMKKAGDDHSDYSFKQGLQVFFIRKILESNKYNMPRLLGSIRGNSFFSEWSKIVCDNIKKHKDFPLTIIVQKDIVEKHDKFSELEGESIRDIIVKADAAKNLETDVVKNVPEPYHELVRNRQFNDLLKLLSDKRLGQLMQIEFSAEVAQKTQEAEPVEKLKDDEKIFDDAIRKEVNKPTGALIEEDYANIESLDLSDKGFNILPSTIGKLTNLTTLDLRNNQLSDLPEAIGKLTNLTVLDLTKNQLSDLPEAIGKLTSLTGLTLRENKLVNLPKAIGKLIYLEWLDLEGNQLTDLPEAITKLTNLTGLDLRNNQLTDLPEAINNLTKLTEFYLNYSN